MQRSLIAGGLSALTRQRPGAANPATDTAGRVSRSRREAGGKAACPALPGLSARLAVAPSP